MAIEQANIIDTFGRVHDYLRISLTERCNLRCFYCMPEQGIQLRDKAEFMTSEELFYIAKTFVRLGVNKIRLTGGEPLVKKDAATILQKLSELPVSLGITTNGVLVDKYIGTFKEVGIKSVNLSLDSLIPERVNRITRRQFYDRIIDNIHLLLLNDFKLKINVVLIKGVNDDEINDFISWTKHYPINVRFIEYMPFNGNGWNWDKTISFKKIIDTVEKRFGTDNILKLESHLNDTAKNYMIKGYQGSFGVISTITNPFCDTCNRIRLTADGKVKNCLFSGEESDLLSALRRGEDIEPIILGSILRKHKSRSGIQNFRTKGDETLFSGNRSMTTIGG